MPAPAMVAIWPRITWLPKSNSCDSVSLPLDKASWMIGTLAALYLRISGGCVPGGICLRDCWPKAVTCAMARLMSTPGWKKSLMTATPGYVCDSTCSTSLTMVVA